MTLTDDDIRAIVARAEALQHMASLPGEDAESLVRAGEELGSWPGWGVWTGTFVSYDAENGSVTISDGWVRRLRSLFATYGWHRDAPRDRGGSVFMPPSSRGERLSERANTLQRWTRLEPKLPRSQLGQRRARWNARRKGWEHAP